MPCLPLSRLPKKDRSFSPTQKPIGQQRGLSSFRILFSRRLSSREQLSFFRVPGERKGGVCTPDPRWPSWHRGGEERQEPPDRSSFHHPDNLDHPDHSDHPDHPDHLTTMITLITPTTLTRLITPTTLTTLIT